MTREDTDAGNHPVVVENTAPESAADPDQQVLVEQADLSDGLAALARLSSAQLTLEELLLQVAGFAVQAIPGADGVGLALLEPDRSDLMVKSADFVRAVDEVQYRLGEGPCVDAADRGVVVRSGSLDTDPRWPQFGPRAGRLGVLSVMSLPLIGPEGTVGAMNVYAHDRDVFDDRAVLLGQLYAGPATVTVHNAHILSQARRLAAQLQAALSTRPLIEQAIGILRFRSGIDAAHAFTRLKQISQTERTSLVEVAEKIVNESVRRARTRNAGPGPVQR